MQVEAITDFNFNFQHSQHRIASSKIFQKSLSSLFTINSELELGLVTKLGHLEEAVLDLEE